MTPPWFKAVSTFALAFMIVVPIADAQSQKTDIRPHALRLMGEEIRLSFEGQIHNGAYNFNFQGIAGNSYIEEHFPNGRVIYKEGDIETAGAWFVQDDTLCFVYEDDLMNGGCFRVYQVENCFYYYSDQIWERKDELDQDYWTARSVIDGEVPECEAAIS